MDNLALSEVKSLAVKMGLLFIHEASSPEWGAETFALYYGNTCLHKTSDLSTVEHYLWGYRDGRTTPTPEAHAALKALDSVGRSITGIAEDLDGLVDVLDKVREFVEPHTRERS